MLMIKSNIGFFNNQGDVTQRQMLRSGQVSNSSNIHIICKFQKDLIKTERVMLMTKSNKSFFSNEEDKILRVMIQSSSFQTLSRFHVHLICKFQTDSIKTEQVLLMTKSNRGFFSNQGDVTLRLII